MDITDITVDECKLTALSILAARGEMDAPALWDAVRQKLGLQLEPKQYALFTGRLHGALTALEAEQGITHSSKCSPDPVRDEALHKGVCFHYAITQPPAATL